MAPIAYYTCRSFIKSTLCVTCESIRIFGVKFFLKLETWAEKNRMLSQATPCVDREEFNFPYWWGNL